ncbi:MAG TPA: hypothetical protein VI818_01170 [Candidatus Thermoplasmatota archaeon]|nr:hypothetical protein [Candidatus Thermoplasmatota archaeon]
MPRIHVRARVRRVGNSLAILLPAAQVKDAGLQAGQTVEAEIETDVRSPVGLLKHIPYEEFQRSKERAWRDRL